MTVWAVAGATGFIGRHLCQALLDQGDRVVALVRADRAGAPGFDAGVEVRIVDFADTAALEKALAGVEVCADLIAPRRNIRGQRGAGAAVVAQLLTAGARAGVRRVVHASSVAIFGHRWVPVDDTSPRAPDTAYGAARLAGEVEAVQVGSRLGIEIVVARLSETLGPGSGSHGPLFQAIARGGFRVIGDGRHSHQLASVTDVVTALIACGRVPDAAGTQLLISGPEIQLRPWIEAIAEAAGTSVRFLGAASKPGRMFLRTTSALPAWMAGGVRRQSWDYMLRPRAYDLTRSLRLLGRYHRSDLREEVGRTMAWYRRHGFLA